MHSDRKGTLSVQTLNRKFAVGLLLLVGWVATISPQAWGQGEIKRKTKNSVPPSYPELARRMNINGVVKVQITVAADGSVKNAKVINAGKLAAVASGPEPAFRKVAAMIEVFAPNGVSYVGDGELARICKIAHNVMLGVVIENLIEITLLANKMGVPRHAFLAFMNNSVMGSMFTRYKAPALVNLDWTTTFTPELLRKDLDLGLALGREHDVPMPVTAATREVLQSHFGAATLKSNPQEYLQKDFSALAETMALAAGMHLESENKKVPSGLET